MTAVLGALIYAYIVFIAAVVALAWICYWKLFKKMGRRGWEGIVPFYNTVVLLRVLDKPLYWFFMELQVIPFAILFQWSAFSGDPSMLLLLLYLVSVAVAIVYAVRITFALSKGFGQGAAMTVGLVLLPVIFLAILAFGDYEFKSPRLEKEFGDMLPPIPVPDVPVAADEAQATDAVSTDSVSAPEDKA